MFKYIKSSLVLLLICSVVAILLAATNFITGPVITENENKAANEALLEVYPGGEGFQEIDISAYELPATVISAYSEANGGYVVRLNTTGYSPNMIIMCGIDANGQVTGAKCLSSGETLGYEKTYGENVVGKDLSSIDTADTVSGATRTTAAYKSAVKDALSARVIFTGGEVDFRSEEEIFLDNLKAAIPSATDDFDRMFMEDLLPGVSDIYRNQDNGYVFIYNGEFIGTDIEGNLVTENVSDETRSVIEGYAEIYLSSFDDEDTVINIENYEGLKNVIYARKTATGNFVLKMNAAGFGINGDEWYNPSGEYIVIKLSLTPDGKIIDCHTEFQAETEGIGSACADPSFYTQFVGKDAASYKEIDAISGATITTNGYKTAVSRAFDALEIIKGGNA